MAVAEDKTMKHGWDQEFAGYEIQPEGAGGYPCHITWPPEVRQIAPGVWLEDLGYQEAVGGRVVVEYHLHRWAFVQSHSKMNGRALTYLTCTHKHRNGEQCDVVIFLGSGALPIDARAYVEHA